MYRPGNASQAGVSSYDVISDGPVVLTGIPASIQIDRTGHPSPALLPGDPIGLPTHRIMLPFSAVPAMGLIRERDVIVDNLARRFQVVVTEWTFIGTQVRAQLLEN